MISAFLKILSKFDQQQYFPFFQRSQVFVEEYPQHFGANPEQIRHKVAIRCIDLLPINFLAHQAAARHAIPPPPIHHCPDTYRKNDRALQ
jgi:hypothetical protein